MVYHPLRVNSPKSAGIATASSYSSSSSESCFGACHGGSPSPSVEENTRVLYGCPKTEKLEISTMAMLGNDI
jgi:hypothetical protein